MHHTGSNIICSSVIIPAIGDWTKFYELYGCADFKRVFGHYKSIALPPLSVTQAVRITLYVSTEHLLSYSVAGDRNTAPAMHNTRYLVNKNVRIVVVVL